MTAMPAPDEPSGLRERSRMRRRARYLRRLRELQLRDIGGFVLELRRFGRERPDLLKEKVEAAAETDRELRALEHELGHGRAVTELREPGIGGACAGCGAVHGSADRYCSWCGREL
jgi:glutathione S-transferase